VKGFYVTYQQYFGYDCTGPDSSMVLKCQHTEVPCRR